MGCSGVDFPTADGVWARSTFDSGAMGTGFWLVLRIGAIGKYGYRTTLNLCQKKRTAAVIVARGQLTGAMADVRSDIDILQHGLEGWRRRCLLHGVFGG